MARWRAAAPARVEPPSWYRSYDPAMWDEMDGHEVAMQAGWTDPWPAWLHDHHSRRRWQEAKYRYRREHPLLQEQEFQELIARRDARLSGS
jgi:hypothetical protein